MKEDRVPVPEPVPGNPYPIPDGRDPGPERNAPSQLSGLRFPFEWCLSALGRVERPRSTAADHGWSALPRDENRRRDRGTDRFRYLGRGTGAVTVSTATVPASAPQHQNRPWPCPCPW